ncbi:MAG: Fic family protein [Acidimicrobiia bacterium]|nr:Fic family protein [Acidimicrobiia bacterium]
MRFPNLEEIIACNEAVREPDEASPSADDDDLDRVARALERVTTETDPVEAAAALAFEIAYAQGFYEGNKRTAALIARWFIATNTALDPDVLIPSFTQVSEAVSAGAHPPSCTRCGGDLMG